MGMKCLSCEYADQGGKHCLGTYAGCVCECQNHTFAPDDMRMDMIALITAEAHEEYSLLSTLLRELDREKLQGVTMLLVKYVVWMLRTAEMDPIATVQEAALYWSGGEPDADDDVDGSQ